jgi:undecaprenyl-diphosphatase
MLDKLIDLDVSLLLELNSHHNPFWDQVMFVISGNLTWVPLYLLVVFLLFRRFGWKALTMVAALVLVFALTDRLSVVLFKDVFHRLRPCHNPDIANMIHLVNGKCGGQYGFISSHAANTFGFAVFTSLLTKRKSITLALLLWACIVSYSRIYLGVHYPGDVICGALFGVLVAFGVFYLYKWLSAIFNLSPKE